MTAELFLEIGTEEIPAGFLRPAMNDLERLLRKELDAARIACGAMRTYATPRRLAIAVQGVAESQERQELTVAGPSVKVAFDADGKPTRAAEGFARANGVAVAELSRMTTDKGEYLYLSKVEEGRPTADLLPEILPRVIAAIPFKKSMRWKDLDIRFARPMHWIVALYDGAGRSLQLRQPAVRQPLLRPSLHGPRALPGQRPAELAGGDPAPLRDGRPGRAPGTDRPRDRAGRPRRRRRTQPRSGTPRRGRFSGRGPDAPVRLLRGQVPGAAARAADHLDARAPALLHPGRQGRQAAAALHHHLQHPPRRPLGGRQGERAGAARPPLRRHVLLDRGPQGQAGEPPRGAQERRLPAEARHQLREGAALLRAGRGPRRTARPGSEGAHRARRAFGQVRPGDRHGLRVPRAAGGDGARVRPPRRRERAGGAGDPRALPADRSRRRNSPPTTSAPSSPSPTRSTPSAAASASA